jgi:hypothetical protein
MQIFKGLLLPLEGHKLGDKIEKQKIKGLRIGFFLGKILVFVNG